MCVIYICYFDDHIYLYCNKIGTKPHTSMLRKILHQLGSDVSHLSVHLPSHDTNHHDTHIHPPLATTATNNVGHVDDTVRETITDNVVEAIKYDYISLSPTGEVSFLNVSDVMKTMYKDPSKLIARDCDFTIFL